MTPRTNVCHHCEHFRVEIGGAIIEADKTRLAQMFQAHVEEVQLECGYYLIVYPKS